MRWNFVMIARTNLWWSARQRLTKSADLDNLVNKLFMCDSIPFRVNKLIFDWQDLKLIAINDGFTTATKRTSIQTGTTMI